MNVGEVSSFKTPAMNAAIKPLDRLIVGSKEAHTAAMEKFEHDAMVHDAQLKALEAELKAAAKKGKNETEAAAEKIKEHKKAAPREPVERRNSRRRIASRRACRAEFLKRNMRR
jgi:putative DNA primase/helicase